MMMRFAVALAILIAQVANAVTLPACADVPRLKGEVHQSSLRLSRPLRVDTFATRNKAMAGSVNTSALAPVPAAALEEWAQTAQPAPIAPSTLFGCAGANTQTAGREISISAPANKDAGEAEPSMHTTPPATARGKTITIRLKRFRSLQEMEVVWEAVALASRMTSRGADVTLLLDMEAVHAVNRHDTAFAEFQNNRGSSERFVSVQAAIGQLVAAGAHVVASDRWARYFGVAGGDALIPGVRLASDDEIADELLTTGNILDY
jgi:hypothetical protein